MVLSQLVKLSVQIIHKTQYYDLLEKGCMAQKYNSGADSNQHSVRPLKETSTREFYLLEKLYEAIREDKRRGKKTSVARELYLMEKLYEVMRKDKIRNKKS